MRKHGLFQLLLLAFIALIVAVGLLHVDSQKKHTTLQINGDQTVLNDASLSVELQKNKSESEFTMIQDKYGESPLAKTPNSLDYREDNRLHIFKAFPLWQRPKLRDQEIEQYAANRYLVIDTPDFPEAFNGSMDLLNVDTQAKTKTKTTVNITKDKLNMDQTATRIDLAFYHMRQDQDGLLYLEFNAFPRVENSQQTNAQGKVLQIVFDPKQNQVKEKIVKDIDVTPDESEEQAMIFGARMPLAMLNGTLINQNDNGTLTLHLTDAKGQEVVKADMTDFIKDKMSDLLEPKETTDNYRVGAEAPSNRVIDNVASHFYIVGNQLYFYHTNDQEKTTLYRWDNEKKAFTSVSEILGLVESLEYKNHQFYLLGNNKIWVLDGNDFKNKATITVKSDQNYHMTNMQLF
ncbi:MAG: hypothetical protein Q4A55_06435 [Aerococcus sp.]|nr:hypothetical protein [Aerococcus sp.]